MITVLSSYLFLVVIVFTSLIALLIELVRILRQKGNSKLAFSFDFIKWSRLIFAVLLIFNSLWDWAMLEDTHIDSYNRANSSFWLFDFTALLISIGYTQLLWIKRVNSTRLGRTSWCLIFLTVVVFSPFVDVLISDYQTWIKNETTYYLQQTETVVKQNAAGITLTSTRNIHLPALVMTLTITFLGLLISRRASKNHCNW